MRLKIKDLRAKRAKITADLRELVNAPAGEGGDLSAEQQTRFDELRAEIETTERAIVRAEFVEDAERRSTGTPIGGGDVQGDGAFEDLCRSFSIRAAIASAVAGATGQRLDAGREHEVSAELQRRTGQAPKGILVPLQVFHERRSAITTALPAGGPGSNMIGTDHRGDLMIDILRAKLVTARLGATVLNGLVGNVDIPRLDQSAIAEWIAENTALSGSTPEFSKITMTPKHVGALVEWSRNMLLQSSPDIEQLMRRDLALVLAEAIDRAAIVGTGGTMPTGVIHVSGVGFVDMETGATWAKILDLISQVETSNSDGNGFTASPRVKKMLRKTPKQTSGVEGNFIMSGDNPNALAGYPFITSTLPSDTGSPSSEPLVFGLWSDLLIGYWGALDILVNPFADSVYSKGNVLCRALLSCDVDVRHPESFAVAPDVGVS